MSFNRFTLRSLPLTNENVWRHPELNHLASARVKSLVTLKNERVKGDSESSLKRLNLLTCFFVTCRYDCLI